MESLQRYSALLSRILGATPDRVMLYDPQGRYLFANRAALESMGRDKVDGLTWSEAGLPAEVGASFEQRFRVVLKDLQPVRAELTYPGEVPRRLESILSPILDEGGRIEAVLNIIRDITERQHSEDSLRKSEENYRSLLEQAVDGILLASPEGAVIGANSTICEMSGYVREDLVGMHVSRLFSGSALEEEPLRFELLKEGRRVISERELLRKDGTSLLVEMNMKMMPDRTYQAILRDLTERQQNLEALRKSEQHSRELLERLQEGFAFADTDERFVFVNPAASTIFGVPEGLLGRYLTEFLDPEAVEEVARQTEHRRHGEKGQYELPIRRPDGEVRILSLSVNPWLDENGEYIGSSGLFQDITERKRTEDALRESEANFRNLLNKLGEGFAIVDPDERWIFANPAAERIFGVLPGQLLGRSMREFVDEDTYREIQRQTSRRRHGETGTYEIQIRRPSGERRYISLSASPYTNEKGEYLGADGIFLDITERKLAERALRESQERYLELFNNNTDAIFWIRVGDTGTFVVESINPAEEARLSCSNSAWAGKSVHEVLPKTLADSVVANFRRCVEAGHPIRYEEAALLPEGLKTFQTQLIPIQDASHRIVRILGFSQDITQSKQAEDALRQAQKLESLGVLAGGIAHDFNNLLTAILGNLNLAQLKSSPESPALPYLENVERMVLKAAELTKQMLAYSGKGRFVVKPHNLNQVVQEMTHLLKVSISKKVLLRYDLSPDLPLIEADAAQIQQVVMNLVTNASEAIGDQEGVIRIATRMQSMDEASLRTSFANQDLQPGSCAILEIADTGSGIESEIMDKIFDPFFSTKQSGRGLGLSAMQGILRGHNAGIQITSAPGRGSCFTLYFPVVQEAASTQESACSEEPEAPCRGRILLVDDEPEVRSSTAVMLETLGLEVITAVDGQDALARFKSEAGSIDLVLLDLTMPRMDGRETFRELRRIQTDIPVILFSGYSEHESLHETLTQGFAGFLQKPFLMSDLRKALQQVQRCP